MDNVQDFFRNEQMNTCLDLPEVRANRRRYNAGLAPPLLSLLAMGGKCLAVMVIFSLVTDLSDGGIMIGITIWKIIPNSRTMDNFQRRKCMQVAFF